VAVDQVMGGRDYICVLIRSGIIWTVDVGSGGRGESRECNARASNLGRSSQIGRPKNPRYPFIVRFS
jgi:hypothetical protein